MYSTRNTLNFTLLALSTLLINAPSPTLAADEANTHQIQLVVVADGETIEFNGESLEVGETRQFFTDSGKEVLLTRTDDGYQFEVDGEEIDLGDGLGEAAGRDFDFDFEGDGHVVIRHANGSKGNKQIKVIRVNEEHHGDGEDVHVMIQHDDPAQHLLDSGALEDLDEATRQRILEALDGYSEDGHDGAHKVIRIEKKTIDSEENEEEGGVE